MKDLRLTFRFISHVDGKRTINFFHDRHSFVKIIVMGFPAPNTGFFPRKNARKKE
jgi:hypothetical protein